MHSITYYKATQEDVPTLVENRILFAIELAGAQDEKTIKTLREQLTSFFKKAIAENTCISYIAKCDNQIAGIGSIQIREQPGNFKNPSGKWGYVMNMYTLPQFRRRGICAGILNELIEEGKKIGITAFELHATAAGEFVYKNNGFNIHQEPTYRKYLINAKQE